MPIYNTGVLSDGKDVLVRRLKLFELASIGPICPPDFEYTVESGDGKSYQIIYPLQERLKNPPIEPTADSGIWDNIEWDRFNAALTVRQKQLEARHQRLFNCAQYILDNCIDEKDLDRIVTRQDYITIYHLAVCPEVTMEVIEQELNHFYLANWGGDDLLTMLGIIKGSPGEYWATRIWEYQLMNNLGMKLEDYSMLDVIDRARRIVAVKVDSWLDIIDGNERKKKDGDG
jgi:hypothetical protein